jgi:1,4-alpha-glucan branching enzyme
MLSTAQCSSNCVFIIAAPVRFFQTSTKLLSIAERAKDRVRSRQEIHVMMNAFSQKRNVAFRMTAPIVEISWSECHASDDVRVVKTGEHARYPILQQRHQNANENRPVVSVSAFLKGCCKLNILVLRRKVTEIC